MLKRCLLAVIVALLVTSSQIAAAEDVDWNSAPKISSKSQLANYIEEGRRKGQTEFNFVITYVKLNNEDEFNTWLKEFNEYITVVQHFNYNLVSFGTGRFIFKITNEYPGTHVANAYLSRNQHQAWMNLTNEEQILYNIAVGIVDEANKRNSEVEKARYIHDEICKRVLEYKNENERNKTAIGALIDHKAQCQGYSDAFYMLGRMARLNVRRISGKFGNGFHVWNTITLSDGRTYCVDVTMDDRYNKDEWFLANYEVMKRHHSCDWSIIPNLQ